MEHTQRLVLSQAVPPPGAVFEPADFSHGGERVFLSRGGAEKGVLVAGEAGGPYDEGSQRCFRKRRESRVVPVRRGFPNATRRIGEPSAESRVRLSSRFVRDHSLRRYGTKCVVLNCKARRLEVTARSWILVTAGSPKAPVTVLNQSVLLVELTEPLYGIVIVTGWVNVSPLGPNSYWRSDDVAYPCGL